MVKFLGDFALLLAAAAAFLPDIEKIWPGTYKAYADEITWGHIIGLSILGLVVAIRIVIRPIRHFFGRRYSISLVYNKHTGELEDRATHDPNVAISRDWLDMILSVGNPSELREIGKQRGKRFWERFVQRRAYLTAIIQWLVKVTNQCGLNISTWRILAKRWAVRFDSKTGMGILDITQLKQNLEGVMKVKNSFTTFTTDSPKCEVLEGYIEGVISAIVGENVKVTVVHRSTHETVDGFSTCVFDIKCAETANTPVRGRN